MLGSDLEIAGDGEPVEAVLVVGLELEVNFELMLDIHEFRRPVRVGLGSFWFLGELGPGSTFSELVRWRICGRCI